MASTKSTYAELKTWINALSEHDLAQFVNVALYAPGQNQNGPPLNECPTGLPETLPSGAYAFKIVQ